MTKHEIDIALTHAGWVIECRSPFEIRHTDGSFATGFAAKLVQESIIDECIDKKIISELRSLKTIYEHLNQKINEDRKFYLRQNEYLSARIATNKEIIVNQIIADFNNLIEKYDIG